MSDAINNSSTGLIKRVTALEQGGGGGTWVTVTPSYTHSYLSITHSYNASLKQAKIVIAVNSYSSIDLPGTANEVHTVDLSRGLIGISGEILFYRRESEDSRFGWTDVLLNGSVLMARSSGTGQSWCSTLSIEPYSIAGTYTYGYIQG